MVATTSHTDVVIVGAGISGINAAYRVQSETSCSYAVLEGRKEIGGTWSLFNYPGIRSDSDMYTLGFAFKPWPNEKTIAGGDEICQYVKDTAAEFGIDKKIEFNSKVIGAEWSSKEALWTVTIEDSETKATRKMTTRFVIYASGYYDYDEGYYPEIKGVQSFKGPILKPQFWPEDLDYAGKKVVIIGSGATAVTLLPNMAKIAKHVTLLQRSPSYFVSLPSIDPISTFARRFLPAVIANTLLRFENQAKSSFFFYMCKAFPNLLRRILRYMVKRQLPPNIPLDPHFNPNYKPWDQRICMVPDGDMFKSFREGTGSIATGHIDHITENSIVLKNGQELEADVIVQATGLKVRLLGGCNVVIDGEKLKINDHFVYKGQMLDGVPNLSMTFGYTNASWSLGSDLCARYICCLLNHMKENGYAICKPVANRSELKAAPLTNLSSGYLQRAKEHMPVSAGKKPWAMKQNYFLDWMRFKVESIKTDMQFTPARS